VKRKRLLTLSQRIAMLIVLGLLANTLLIINYSEKVLETSIFHQLQKQALIYLYEIEHEIQLSDDPMNPQQLQAVIQKKIEPPPHYDFSIFHLYVYDQQGNILAHNVPGEHPKTDISSHYGEIFKSGEPYMGEEIEYEHYDKHVRSVPVTDIIIPLTINGRVLAGIEIELNLQQNMALVKTIDDPYESTLLSVIITLALAILLFLWWVINHGLIQPINALHDVTENISAGDLSSRSNIKTGDELGDLGHSINNMVDNIERLIKEQNEAYLQVLQSLAKALEKKDAYTAGHSARVRKFSMLLARRCELNEDDLAILQEGALLHDLGKIGIPDAVLNKASKLTDEEYELIRSHPVMTAEIMRPLKHFHRHAEIAAWHHERWDGKGYPDGLKGEKIPLLARIVSIADTWDAMTGGRVYRKGMAYGAALDKLEQERDHGQFDPLLLDVFIKMMRETEEVRNEFLKDTHIKTALDSGVKESAGDTDTA